MAGFSYVHYIDTGYFSSLVNDYTTSSPVIRPFFTYTPDADGIASAIEDRAKYPVNRKALTDALSKQYEHLTKSAKTEENIQLLLNENTYTICTAHQPNLLTGYLYFVYKILHAIKLADELGKLHSDKHFVPVYYMGSEDNDLEELGTFRYRGDKYIWDGNGQTGAVGRMDTATLKKLLNDLFRVMGPPGAGCDHLKEILTTAYLQHKTVGAATQYLVNELFGRYGLLVLDPDDAALKATYIPVMEDELLHQNALPVINQQIAKLSDHYKIQAHPRPINLFYLADQVRERIEQQGDKWVVLNTDISWNKEKLLAELHSHPERFSPNVMLRGLFQETILPNVAFIGGGAEVAYWMQLQPLFAHYKVFFPAILLRQSVLWIPEQEDKLRHQLELSTTDIFMAEDELVRYYMARLNGDKWQVTDEKNAMKILLDSMQQKAADLDPTLGPAVAAALKKMQHQLDVLETKMLRAEKRKNEIQLLKIIRLRKALFPNNSLQERVENFLEYYLEYGPGFFDTIKEGIKPFEPMFLVVG